jgi:hypothetical protein
MRLSADRAVKWKDDYRRRLYPHPVDAGPNEEGLEILHDLPDMGNVRTHAGINAISCSTPALDAIAPAGIIAVD